MPTLFVIQTTPSISFKELPLSHSKNSLYVIPGLTRNDKPMSFQSIYNVSIILVNSAVIFSAAALAASTTSSPSFT